MVWYEKLDRTIPYQKIYRGFNLWYDFNNGKHHDMKRLRTVWLEHWLKRFCKHEAYSRSFIIFCIFPLYGYLFSTYKRFQPLKKSGTEYFSGAQYVANIGRNHYGFETRATKSFEHAMSTLLGRDILSHILSMDSDVFRKDETGDEDKGLVGDFSEEDIISLKKQENHLPHVGIVYFRPEMHYLNEKPNDFLSPYKVDETI